MREGIRYKVDIGFQENLEVIVLKIKDDKIRLLLISNLTKTWFKKSEIKLIKQLTF
jgi:hypothetical protein